MAYIGAGTKNIGAKSLSHPKDDPRNLTRSTGSNGLSTPLPQANDPQKTLSRNIAEHLLHLMKEVTNDEVNPKTVNAACQCAAELYKVMKLNLEMKRHKI